MLDNCHVISKNVPQASKLGICSLHLWFFSWHLLYPISLFKAENSITYFSMLHTTQYILGTLVWNGGLRQEQCCCCLGESATTSLGQQMYHGVQYITYLVHSSYILGVLQKLLEVEGYCTTSLFYFLFHSQDMELISMKQSLVRKIIEGFDALAV